MKFSVFDLYNHKSGNKVECAIVKTENSYILITVLNNITKVRQYMNKKELVKDLIILKRKTKSILRK